MYYYYNCQTCEENGDNEYGTTEKDFEIFKTECQRWIDVLGLKNWEMFYTHNPSDCRASITYDLVGRVAKINLSSVWRNMPEVTEHEIKKAALHEVLELLLARLTVLAKSRFTTDLEIDEAQHEVIRTMENVLKDRL